MKMIEKYECEHCHQKKYTFWPTKTGDGLCLSCYQKILKNGIATEQAKYSLFGKGG
jgi:NAD-dependent SIR2 family protein deacetylase